MPVDRLRMPAVAEAMPDMVPVRRGARR
jgi:hypothetical protein